MEDVWILLLLRSLLTKSDLAMILSHLLRVSEGIMACLSPISISPGKTVLNSIEPWRRVMLLEVSLAVMFIIYSHSSC